MNRASVSAAPTSSAKPIPAPAGFTKITQVSGQTVFLIPGNNNPGTAICPEGTTIIGGGYKFNDPWSPLVPPSVVKSYAFNNQWIVWGINAGAGAANASFTVYAYCIS